jgi:hypothetical protein
MHIEYVEYSQEAADDQLFMVKAGVAIAPGESADMALDMAKDWTVRQLGLPEEAKSLRAEVEKLTFQKNDLKATVERLNRNLAQGWSDKAQMETEIERVKVEFKRYSLAGEAIQALKHGQEPTIEQMTALLEVALEGEAQKRAADMEKAIFGNTLKTPDLGPDGKFVWNFDYKPFGG